jgi:hypothetical protein
MVAYRATLRRFHVFRIRPRPAHFAKLRFGLRCAAIASGYLPDIMRRSPILRAVSERKRRVQIMF